MDDENQIEESEPIEIKPTGIPTELGVVMCILIALLAAAAIYIAQRKPESSQFEANNNAIIAQAAAQKAQVDYQMACIKRDTDLRLKVVEQCVAKGNIPIFAGGNVDCKPSPK